MVPYWVGEASVLGGLGQQGGWWSSTGWGRPLYFTHVDGVTGGGGHGGARPGRGALCRRPGGLQGEQPGDQGENGEEPLALSY